jgi:hypothetical protein
MDIEHRLITFNCSITASEIQRIFALRARMSNAPCAEAAESPLAREHSASPCWSAFLDWITRETRCRWSCGSDGGDAILLIEPRKVPQNKTLIRRRTSGTSTFKVGAVRTGAHGAQYRRTRVDHMVHRCSINEEHRLPFFSNFVRVLLCVVRAMPKSKLNGVIGASSAEESCRRHGDQESGAVS